MGVAEPRGSELADLGSAVLRGESVFAHNTGVCVEDSHIGTKVHLGSGSIYWDGWLNVDLHGHKADLKCDLRKLELPDDHASVAVAIHVIEHFYLWDATTVLREWRRILKPGGVLILELPCMDKVFHYIASCMNSKSPLLSSFSWFAFWGDPSHRSEAMCHKWGYTIDSIKELVTAAGFEGVVSTKPRYHFPARDMRIEACKP